MIDTTRGQTKKGVLTDENIVYHSYFPFFLHNIPFITVIMESGEQTKKNTTDDIILRRRQSLNHGGLGKGQAWKKKCLKKN